MTIAAGFKCTDGVLLCADTQYEGGETKIFAPKVGCFDCSDGKIAYALAGRVVFAQSAIAKCESGLKGIPANCVVEQLRKTLDKEYRRLVYGHPDRNSWDIPYWLLIAVYLEGREPLLFAAEDTTLNPVKSAECIGIGKDLAGYLIRPVLPPNAALEDALLLASYTLSQVKKHVAGCGGESQFMSIGNDGEIRMMREVNLDQLEIQSEIYNTRAQRLLLDMADARLDDAAIDQRLREFTEHAKRFRKCWRSLAEIIRLAAGEQETIDLAAQQDPESTTTEQ